MKKVNQLNFRSHIFHSINALFCAVILFFSPLIVLAEEVVLPEMVEPQTSVIEEVVPPVETVVEEPVLNTPEVIVEESIATTSEVNVEETLATTTEPTTEVEVEEPTSSSTEILDLILKSANATTSTSSPLSIFTENTETDSNATTSNSESTPEIAKPEEEVATTTEVVEEIKETALVSDVLTPTGYKSISELTVGDEVVGYDIETGEKVTNHIEKVELITPVHYNYWEEDEEGTYTNYVEVPFTSYKINNHYSLFKDQSVFANGRVVHANELSVGDTFYTIEGVAVTIETLEAEVSSDQWVKLSVSGNHTYVAGDMVLHNASRYWVGGGSSQNWNATGNTNWGSASNTRDNASVPGASDDVIFDGVGFGASNSTVSAGISINSLDMTGYTNTLTHNAFTIAIAGNKLKLSSSMTYTLANSLTSAFSFTSTTGTSGSPTAITTAGKTLGNITFSGLGGYFALQDDLLSSGTLTLTTGTFDANGKNVSINNFVSSNANARTLTVGNGTWNITGGSVVVWSMTTITNLTITSRPTINLTYAGSIGTRTITPGVLVENLALNVNVSAGSDIITISTNHTLGSLNFTGFSGSLTNDSRIIYGDLTFGSAMTIANGSNTTTMSITSGTSTITSNGVLLGLNININAPGAVVRLADDILFDSLRSLTLTTGTFDANNKNVSVGAFSSSGSTIRTLSVGSGTWNLTGSSSSVWNTATVTNFTLLSKPTLNFTSTSSTGTRTIAPGAFAENVAPNINITAGSDTITIGASSLLGSLNFTGFSGTLSTGVRTIYGDLTFAPGMTVTNGSNVTTMGITSGTSTITSNGVLLGLNLTINAPGGVVRLADDLVVSVRTFTLNAGTFDANNKNVSVGLFNSNSSSARTLTAGTGTWNITGNNATVFTITPVTNFSITTRPTFNLTYSGSVGTRTVTMSSSASESLAPDFNVTAGSDTVTFSTNSILGNINFTGFSGTLSNGTRTLYGDLVLSPEMVITGGSGVTSFSGTSGTSTITTNGQVVEFPITINGAGKVFQLADNLTLGSTRVLTLNSGTLDANNKNVSVGYFNSSNSNVRTLTVGTGTWNVTGNNATVWTTATNANLTLTTRPTVNLTYAGDVGLRTISTGVGTPEEVAANFNIATGTDSINVQSGPVGNLNFTGFSGNMVNSTKNIYGDLILSPTMTFATGTANIIMKATNGTKIIYSAGLVVDTSLTIDGAGGTFQLADDLNLGSTYNLILTSGTLDVGNHNIIAKGFSSSNTNTRTLNMGSGTWTLNGTNVVWNTLIQTGLTLNPQSSTLVLVGTNQKIYGSNTFNNLTKIASSSDILFFQKGSTQRIVGTLELKGVENNNLSLEGYNTFTNYVDSPTLPTPSAIASIDVNSDGKRDLIITASGTLSIHLGNGNGTFVNSVDYASGGTDVKSISVADFNNDGKPDIAVPANDTGQLLVFMNNGNGTFANFVQYSCSGTCTGVSSGDFNSDGKIDIAAANVTESTVSIFINNGNGTFASAVTFATVNSPQKIAVADFNNDGKTDLVVGGRFTSALAVHMNNGDGSFAANADIVTSTAVAGISTTDISGDGIADILIATVNAFAYFINNGDGTFGAEIRTGSLTREDIVLGDADNDGDTDAFVTTNTSASNGGPGVRVWINNGDGTFTAEYYAETVVGSGTKSATVGDINGDGFIDIVAINQIANTYTVFLNLAGQQWNINPEGERDLAYLNVKDSNNTNPVFIAAYNAPGVTNSGNNTGWYFTAPTVGTPVSYGSTVTGGSGSSPLSMPDSLITTTPEGLKVSEYDTKVKTVSKNEVTPTQHTFTENSYAEVGGANTPLKPEKIENEKSENINQPVSTTTSEKEEIVEPKNSVVKKIGWAALIILIIGFLMRKFLRRFA